MGPWTDLGGWGWISAGSLNVSSVEWRLGTRNRGFSSELGASLQGFPSAKVRAGLVRNSWRSGTPGVECGTD